jgi:hypothetical protein
MYQLTRGRATKLEQATNYEPAFDIHAIQRFHNNFMIMKTLWGATVGVMIPGCLKAPIN